MGGQAIEFIGSIYLAAVGLFTLRYNWWKKVHRWDSNTASAYVRRDSMLPRPNSRGLTFKQMNDSKKKIAILTEGEKGSGEGVSHRQLVLRQHKCWAGK